MDTIVTNNKHPDEKPRGQEGKTEGEPIGNVQAQVHQEPDEKIRNYRIDDLPGTTG
jgi:hypothetical protein